MSDYSTSFATVSLGELLAALELHVPRGRYRFFPLKRSGLLGPGFAATASGTG